MRLTSGILAIVAVFMTVSLQAQGWNGLFVGVHAGQTTVTPEFTEPAFVTGVVNPDVDGLTAGALLAYRSGKLGFDVELGIADVSGGEVPSDGGFTEFEAEWLSRARLTLSHPVGNTLLFAAAGGAAMRFYVNDAFTEDTAPEVLIQDPRFVTLTGWTIGAGAERMMRERISLRVEAIYDSFGGEDLSENPGEGRIEPTSTTIRAAILFRF